MALPVRTVIPLAGANSLVSPHLTYNFQSAFPTAGNIFFVHASGSSTGSGLSPGDAVSTIDGGINLCTANQGDTVIVLPGHAESIASAAAIAADVAGINIVGLGHGADRPTITFTNTAATIAVSAASVLFKNLIVRSDVDELVKMFNITGASCTLDGVDHREYDTSKQTLQFVLTTNAADFLTIKNCVHMQPTNAAAATQKWIQLVGVDYARILDNTFFLKLKNETASHIISGSTAVVFCEIARNRFWLQGGTTQDTIVNLVTGSTGWIYDNYGYSSTGVATAAAYTGDACAFAENRWADTAAASGLLAPVVDTDT